MELKKLIETLSLLESNFLSVEVYVFGSILISNRFEDIDILLIYQDYDDLMSLKKEIQDLFPFELIHFTCLTKKEELELNFVEQTNAFKIKTTHNRGTVLKSKQKYVMISITLR